jgi:uncharacterized RDD family membrane protein YckC
MKPCQLDLRLLDLQVRSQRSDLAVVVPSASTGKASRSGWKVGLAIALALTLSLGVWLAVRRNRRAHDLSAGSVAADE